MRRRIPLIFVILVLATANSFLPLVLGVTYIPRVGVGNFIKFGNSESYSSDDPTLQATPQFLKDIDNRAFLRAEVENVSGTSVTYKMTQSFNNGTADRTMILVEDVNTGAGNATSGGVHYVFIAGGLRPGDTVANNANAPSIDQTVTRTYAGASRDVDLSSSTGSINANFSLTSNQYWDQASGVLTELSFSAIQKSGSSRQYTTTWSDLLFTEETNIWSASNTGISQILFYAILGTVGAMAAIAGVIVVTRMRRSDQGTNIRHSPQASGSPDLSKMVQCDRCHGHNLPGASTCTHCGAQIRA